MIDIKAKRPIFVAFPFIVFLSARDPIWLVQKLRGKLAEGRDIGWIERIHVVSCNHSADIALGFCGRCRLLALNGYSSDAG